MCGAGNISAFENDDSEGGGRGRKEKGGIYMFGVFFLFLFKTSSEFMLFFFGAPVVTQQSFIGELGTAEQGGLPLIRRCTNTMEGNQAQTDMHTLASACGDNKQQQPSVFPSATPSPARPEYKCSGVRPGERLNWLPVQTRTGRMIISGG